MSGNSHRLVTDGDRGLFKALAHARLFDREQASAVSGRKGVSMSTCNAWLLKLVRAGLLRRFFIATEQRGIKALYSLTPASAALVHVEYRPVPRPADSVLTSEPFVLHQLAVNSVLIQVKYREMPSEDVSFVRWISFSEPLSPETQLVPDSYFELKTPIELHSMFCEVDRGTEPQKTWAKKVELYLRLATSGEFQRLFQNRRFRVLVIADSERRLLQISKTVAQQTSKIFWFSTHNAINRQGLFAAHWLRPAGDSRFSLL